MSHDNQSAVTQLLHKIAARLAADNLRRGTDVVTLTRDEFALLHYSNEARASGTEPEAVELAEWRKLSLPAALIEPQAFTVPAVRLVAERILALPPQSRRGMERLGAVLRGELCAAERELSALTDGEELEIANAYQLGGALGAYNAAMVVGAQRGETWLADAVASQKLPDMLIIEFAEVNAEGWRRERMDAHTVNEQLTALCARRGIDGPPTWADLEKPADGKITVAGQYCWSIDEEDFQGHFPTPEDAAAEAFALYPEASRCWVGDTVRYHASRFIDGDRIIESASERAGDEVGERSEDWLSNVPAYEVARFETIVGNALQNLEAPAFFGVDNVVEILRPAPAAEGAA